VNRVDTVNGVDLGMPDAITNGSERGSNNEL
jgi:hypothetical protein